MNWTRYVVRAGDHLDQLAARFGFRADEVWRDPRNADLRARRPDPRMLAPGDVLQVPRAAPSHTTYQHRGETRFVARSAVTQVKTVLRDARGPLAGVRCEVRLPGAAPRAITTGADGALAFEVPVETREVPVFIESLGVVLTLCPGGLDPVDTPRGVRQRLHNLGHYPLTMQGDALAGASDADHRAAVKSFRRAERLPDGEHVDDALTRALVRAHGV